MMNHPFQDLYDRTYSAQMEEVLTAIRAQVEPGHAVSDVVESADDYAWSFVARPAADSPDSQSLKVSIKAKLESNHGAENGAGVAFEMTRTWLDSRAEEGFEPPNVEDEGWAYTEEEIEHQFAIWLNEAIVELLGARVITMLARQ